MTIEELKSSIEQKTLSHNVIFLNSAPGNFITEQYIHEIASMWEFEIQWVEDLSHVNRGFLDLFGIAQTDDNLLRVYVCDTLPELNKKVFKEKDLIVVFHKSASEIKDAVKIPDLEIWQIKDYIYSVCDGVPTSKLDWLITVCGSDIHRLYLEVSKLILFPTQSREYLFDAMVREDCFGDLSDKNIFNFTSCITTKDKKKLLEVYKDLDNIDISEMGLLSILYQNFKNIASIQLSNNPTPESTGLKTNQFYAVQKSCGHYGCESLTKIVEFLSGMDQKIRTGNVPSSIVIDYLTVKILSM